MFYIISPSFISIVAAGMYGISPLVFRVEKERNATAQELEESQMVLQQDQGRIV